MNKPAIVAFTALCVAALSAPAWAFCAAGDPQGCTQPITNSGSSLQSDGATTQQGFDAQTGNQWSASSHKMGDFTFYSGVSSGNGWRSRDPLMGNSSSGPDFDSQNHADSFHCAYYGTC
jgi:hypothetical protein